jgi:hypothetical protein
MASGLDTIGIEYAVGILPVEDSSVGSRTSGSWLMGLFGFSLGGFFFARFFFSVF